MAQRRIEHVVAIGHRTGDGYGAEIPGYRTLQAKIHEPGMVFGKAIGVRPTRVAETLRHGQVYRQQTPSREDGEHVAEVRGRRHLDVLDHVGVRLASLDDAFLQHHQVLFKQDDVRRFLGDVHGRIDRNADVRRLYEFLIHVIPTFVLKRGGIIGFRPVKSHDQTLAIFLLFSSIFPTHISVV